MLVQDSECFFASYKILTLLRRLSLEDSRLPCVKIFHTIAFNQKRPDFNMETTLGSALYCLQLRYLHLYSSLFVFWKKTPTERNRKKKVVLLQQTWKLSVTHHHMASWILILSTCIPEESYLLWASFSLPVSLVSLTLACWARESQDSRESQTFVAVTLMYTNYWGNLVYELGLGIRVHVKILLTFCLSKIRRGDLSPKAIQIYGYSPKPQS